MKLKGILIEGWVYSDDTIKLTIKVSDFCKKNSESETNRLLREKYAVEVDISDLPDRII